MRLIGDGDLRLVGERLGQAAGGERREGVAEHVDEESRLHRRAARAEILRNEVIARHTDTVCNALWPHKALQEREIAGLSFVAKYGPWLLATLYGAIHSDCHDHQVIEVQG